MREYQPDCWKLVKIVSPKHGTIYKVLAGWYGGFARGDSWKLSSGTEDVQVQDDLIRLPQYSGSVYLLHEGCEHMSSLMHGVYNSFVEDIEGTENSIELITLDELKHAFSYKKESS
jgi:hypothetical protein